MDNWVPGLWAGLIGGAGSLAYSSALYFGFIQNEASLSKLWPSRGTSGAVASILRVVWFVAIGAAVALIFQLPEGNLAPIQAFIIGTTWPTVVAQVLTGRQGDSPASIKAQIFGLLEEGKPSGRNGDEDA